MSKSYIKCSECNTINLDREYCSKCGAILNIIQKRKLEREKKEEDKKEEEPSQISEFLRKGAIHPNTIIRTFFQVFNSIWMFFSMIFGAIIAAVIAAAAG